MEVPFQIVEHKKQFTISSIGGRWGIKGTRTCAGMDYYGGGEIAMCKMYTPPFLKPCKMEKTFIFSIRTMLMRSDDVRGGGRYGKSLEH